MRVGFVDRLSFCVMGMMDSKTKTKNGKIYLCMKCR